MYRQLLIASVYVVIAVELLEALSVFHKHNLRNARSGSLRRALSSQTKRESIECVGNAFVCADQSLCIHDSLVCDGEIHCDDGSDEVEDYCLSIDCDEGELRCATGSCINEELYCSGYSRCFNQGVVTTPVECPQAYCNSSAIACPNSTRCILKAYVCDTYNDCGDNSDEENCSEIVCEADERRCNSGQCFNKEEYCFNPWQRRSPCVDGSDFTGLCLDVTCPQSFFKCHSDGKCLYEDHLCDGYKDCADGSDEADTTCASYQCPSYRHKCLNGKRCIDAEDVCNNINNCGDNSDEASEFCNSRECGDGYIRCASGQCLIRWWFCNTQSTRCSDGSRSPNEPAVCEFAWLRLNSGTN